MASQIYHERQRLQQCMLHTLNNLFQQEGMFTHADLDALCAQLAPQSHPLLNPHRTLLLGNWDVNVLEVALGLQGKELCWYDQRDSSFKHLELDGCWGIIVNVKASGRFAWLLRGRHWFGLRCLGGRWHNLDSHLAAPELVDSEGVGDAEAMRRFLEQQVQQHDAKVFLVKDRPASQPQ